MKRRLIIPTAAIALIAIGVVSLSSHKPHTTAAFATQTTTSTTAEPGQDSYIQPQQDLGTQTPASVQSHLVAFQPTTTGADPDATTTTVIGGTTTTVTTQPTATSQVRTTTSTIQPTTTTTAISPIVEPLPENWNWTSPCHGTYPGECLATSAAGPDGLMHPIIYDPAPYPGWPNPPTT